MSQPVITRWDAVQEINKGMACTIEYVECNVSKGTGGKLVKLTNWARLTKDLAPGGLAGMYQSRETWQRQVDTLDQEIIKMYNPTNNMQHPRPVHYWLLCSLNGKRIV